MVELLTARMRIVSGTPELAQAELQEPERLATLLGADVLPSWPPETLRDVLALFLDRCRENGNCGQWTLGWYGILKDGARPVLCGSIGFKGPPDQAGMVELGYALLPEYWGRGIAGEMVARLSTWALEQSEVRTVEAEVEPNNMPSIRVLERCGFAPIGAGREAKTTRFRLSAWVLSNGTFRRAP